MTVTVRSVNFLVILDILYFTERIAIYGNSHCSRSNIGEAIIYTVNHIRLPQNLVNVYFTCPLAYVQNLNS